MVQFWCGDKAARNLYLPLTAPSFVWKDEYAGKELKAERTADGIRFDNLIL